MAMGGMACLPSKPPCPRRVTEDGDPPEVAKDDLGVAGVAQKDSPFAGNGYRFFKCEESL